MREELLNKEYRFQRRSSGFSIIEVILAGSLFAIVMTGVMSAVLYGAEGSSGAGARSEASFLGEEGLDVMQNIRDESFTNLLPGTFGLAVSSSRWVTSGTQDIVDVFTRQIGVSSTDSKRRDVTARIVWSQNPVRSGSISLTTRLTDWRRAAWTAPTRQTGIDSSGNNDGLKVQVQGDFAYFVRNDGTPDFVAVNITNSAAPTIVGSLSLSGAPVNIAVSGNFAYVSSDDNTQELQIINITNPAAPSLAGSLNLNGTANGDGIFVVGTTVYYGRVSSGDPEFLVINASNPAAPTITGSFEVGAGTLGIWVSGAAAYVASDSGTQEFQVIDISTPSAPTRIGLVNLAGTTNATTITGIGTVAVIGQGSNVHKINITTPASPSLMGTLAVGGTVNDVTPSDDGSTVFLATSNTAADFQAIDITGAGAPTLLGSVNLSGTINGVAYDPPPRDRVYAVGALNTEEFTVIQP